MRLFRRRTANTDAGSTVDPASALERLRTNPALARQERLPQRPTFEEWQSLSPDERSAPYEPQIVAVQSLSRSELDEVEATIRLLGEARYEAAIPLLASLWRTCPITPVRLAAGYGLLTIRSAEAFDVLWSRRHDWELAAATLASRSRLVADPVAAYDLAERLVDGAHAGDVNAARLVNEMLGLLTPSTFDWQGKEGWTEPDAPRWLRDDERWIALCTRLRSDETFGEAARQVLRYQPKARVKSALARESKAPPVAVALRRRVEPWLVRYQAGEFISVWDEIANLGAIPEPEIRDEAQAVADEMMGRVAAAIAEIRERLNSLGYPLRPQSDVDRDIEERLNELERVAGGRVPVSFASFWRIVGGINLAPIEDAEWPSWMPSDQRWQTRLDPLVIDPLSEAWYSVEEWLEDRSEHLAEVVGPLELAIAPDALHKVNVSGGPPYAVRLPDQAADAPIRNLAGAPHLVPYLRVAIERGGFPGMPPDSDPSPQWRVAVARLTVGLPEF
jgi:hypothetical protein